MKVASARVAAFAARPDPKTAGLLLHGPDPLEIDALRQAAVAALLASAGEGAELTRLDAAEARRDPAALSDALRSGGLFGGRPVVWLENAADGAADSVQNAVQNLPDDAGRLLVTAGQLNARSKLRKLFEDVPQLASLAVYPAAPDRAAIAHQLRDADIRADEDAVDALLAFAHDAEPADLRAAIRSLSIYMLSSDAPATPRDVAAILPGALEGEADDVVSAAAAKDLPAALAAFARISARNSAAIEVGMKLGRQFRQLHLLASAAGGPDQAVAALRPPLYGPRKDAMLRAARQWPLKPAEAALELILNAELQLRSTTETPAHAIVERLLVRLCTLRAR